MKTFDLYLKFFYLADFFTGWLLSSLNALLGWLFYKSISISCWIHVVGFHFITLSFSQILLYYCKEFLWWLLLQSDFQLTTLNSCGKTGWIFYSKFDHIILTTVGFCVISPWSFSGFLSYHKKALLRWSLYLHAKFHPIPFSGLPCRRDRPLTFFNIIYWS